MTCPNCKKLQAKLDAITDARSKGGKAKNPRKGFGSPAVLAKALETRKARLTPTKESK